MRNNMLKVVRNYMVMAGVHGSDLKGFGWERDISVPGWDIRTITNVPSRIQRDGRTKFFEMCRRDETQRQAIVSLPKLGQDMEPETMFVVIPFADFVKTIIKEQEK
jgi:hypothetical protein